MEDQDYKGKIVVLGSKDDLDSYWEVGNIVIGDKYPARMLATGKTDMIVITGGTEVASRLEFDELYAARAAKAKEQIEAVQQDLKKFEEEFDEHVIVKIRFGGSLPKQKAWTPNEQERIAELIASGGENVDPKKLKGTKPLFESKEYDSLMNFNAKRRDEFASLGIPFGENRGMTIVHISRVPDVIDLAERTPADQQVFIDELIAAYPEQISQEAVEELQPIKGFYNASDYAPVETLSTRFSFNQQILQVGPPEILMKKLDKDQFLKEMEKAATEWQAVKENGIVVLRKEFNDLVETLTNSVTDSPDGKKKRFYESSVNKLDEFFSNFSSRNIAKDSELESIMQQMRDLVANKSLDDFKKDDDFRATVKRSGEQILSTMQSLLIDEDSRSIEL